MTVRLTPHCVVLRGFAADTKLVRDSSATAASCDSHLTALAFGGEADRLQFAAALREKGIDFGTTDHPQPWLVVDGECAWFDGSDRGEISELVPLEHPPFQRLEILSRSESGLAYVRERKSGILRQLTEEELRDFNDPPPCAHCGEQFGCEHFNCAGEPLMNENEIDADVPQEWRRFAHEEGISRNDVARLRLIEQSEGQYRIVPNADSDLRTMELLLLLNES